MEELHFKIVSRRKIIEETKKKNKRKLGCKAQRPLKSR